jgi:transcriptional regulator with XRE-family HTH domain
MDAQFYVSVGEQIRSHRIQQGMTQQALADKVNISQNSLSLIEDGLATPIHTKLILIQDYFQVKFKINGKYAKIETFLEEKAKELGKQQSTKQ